MNSRMDLNKGGFMYYSKEDIQAALKKTGNELADNLESMLDGQDYDQGRLEDSQSTVDNIARAFGRLLALLHTRNHLTSKEIIYLLQEYEKDPNV